MEKGTSSGSRSDCESDSDSVDSNYSFMHCEAMPSSTLERGGIFLTVEWEESLKAKLTQIDIELEAGDSALNTQHLLGLPSLAIRARARPIDSRESTIDSSGICVVLCPVGQGLSCVSDAWMRMSRGMYRVSGTSYRVYRNSNQQEWTEYCRAGTTSLGLS